MHLVRSPLSVTEREARVRGRRVVRLTSDESAAFATEVLVPMRGCGWDDRRHRRGSMAFDVGSED